MAQVRKSAGTKKKNTLSLQLLFRYCTANWSLKPPPLFPPSSITPSLPQMSGRCCHVKLKPIGCNQGTRQIRPLCGPVTSTRSPFSCSSLFSLREPRVLFLISVHTHWPRHFSPS